MTEVITLAGWPPEILAYAFAMYSRSSLSIRESIMKITDSASGKFLEQFYFKFGHKSIADNAHIPLAVENIPQIAVYELEDEQLWDGTERSTRYQDFGRADSYLIPRAIRGTRFESVYRSIAEYELANYRQLSQKCFDRLRQDLPKPTETKEEDYERTLRARAFDVARYWLFGGILTSVGQITSARTLEEQISRLLSSEYDDTRELAESMKAACLAKPFCPEGKEEQAIAPTLVKYAAASNFRIALRRYMRKTAQELLKPNIKIVPKRYVRLASRDNFMSILNETVSTLLYEASNYPYHEIYNKVRHLSGQKKQDIIDSVLSYRGAHDPMPKTFASGFRLQYDICMDRGGERDLHRHRNCIQIHQPLTTDRGWDTPELLTQMGLADEFNNGMAAVGQKVRELKKEIGVNADYLIPFAYRSGTLYKMHLAEAMYLTELRSGTQGHFSYREIACQMFDQTAELLPWLKPHSRVTPFKQQNLLKR